MRHLLVNEPFDERERIGTVILLQSYDYSVVVLGFLMPCAPRLSWKSRMPLVTSTSLPESRRTSCRRILHYAVTFQYCSLHRPERHWRPKASHFTSFGSITTYMYRVLVHILQVSTGTESSTTSD